MEPTLPVARSLAVAGERVAGGVGTHETALPSPDRVDLGRRCVVPGFSDAHVHFPTWAVAQHEVRLEDTRSLDEALARVREALDAFEATRDEWQPRGLRPRIEHAQLLAPEDVPRFAQLGLAASVQFSHAPSDRDLAERFWGEKTAGAYAYRSLLDAGTVVANGSDAPIEELDPLAGIRAGVLRTLDDRPAWHPEQVVTIEEALRATTVDPP